MGKIDIVAYHGFLYMQIDDSATQVVFYFKKKTQKWQRTGVPVTDYIKKAGVSGLASEFRLDPNFIVVCNFIRQAGTLQLRSQLLKGFEEFAGLLFGIPLVGAMDIIIGAIEEACGQKVAGELLIKGITAVVGGAALIGIITGLGSAISK